MALQIDAESTSFLKEGAMGTKHPHHSPGEDEPAHTRDHLDHSLSEMAVEAGKHPYMEGSRRSFERLANILMRPAQRIARARLEEILPRDQVGPDEINAVVSMAMYELYKKLGQGYYKPGMSLVSWFGTIVGTCAREFGRHHPTAGSARRHGEEP
ncbi:MAG TPA: hypothetical protein VF006_24185 [Longimicrobium sp.]